MRPLQGNIATPGLFIFAIGEAQKMWPHGNEPAFTVIPNFLLTGIVAMLVGLAIIIWSLGFVQKKNGPTAFILLFILLFLVGGGVAQILFFPYIWLVSTCINQPLTWWRKALYIKFRESLARVWPWLLAVSAALLVYALIIAITGVVPGVNNPKLVLSIMLVCLGIVVLALPLTFVAGFAYDIVLKTNVT